MAAERQVRRGCFLLHLPVKMTVLTLRYLLANADVFELTSVSGWCFISFKKAFFFSSFLICYFQLSVAVAVRHFWRWFPHGDTGLYGVWRRAFILPVQVRVYSSWIFLNQIEIFPTSKWVLAYTLEQNESHLLHVQMKKWHWQFKIIFHMENFCKDDVCAKKKAFCPGSGFKVPLTGLCGCSWCSGIRMQPCCDRCPLTEQETQKSHTASSCWSN